MLRFYRKVRFPKLHKKIFFFLLFTFVALFLTLGLLRHKILIESFRIAKPQPIVKSDVALSKDVQQELENLARREIKQEQAQANLPINITADEPQNAVSDLALNIRERLTSNPSGRAKIKIEKINNLIAKLKKQNADDAIGTISEIGRITDGVVRDPVVQTDREILGLIIEQYNRLQLVIQILEDQLPAQDFLKIEEARQKYLVVTATQSINSAPSLDVVHNIALKEVASVVGRDFAELKAIEIITDFEDGIKPQSKEKLAGLEKGLAVEFEKRMLKLPKDIRKRKLENYINYSFGNPVRQLQAFDRMNQFLSSGEIENRIDSLKLIALQNVEDRAREMKDEKIREQFLTGVKDPRDLKELKSNLDKPQVDRLSLDQKQHLYEKVQKITQKIFLTSDNGKSDFEKDLPVDTQEKIKKLKKELPSRNVPKIVTPAGVTLSDTAKLPDDVQTAIVAVARKRIEQAKRPASVEKDLQVEARDLGIKEPLVLPDNPLYVVKELVRKIALVVTIDPASRAGQLIKQDNVRTIEAARLIKKQDTRSIKLALGTLEKVQEDFELLKANTEGLRKLKEKSPDKIDRLIDQIIKNGVARQTVLSAIEDKVYGDDFVRVEKIRSQILKDGVDTLLGLADGDAKKLTDKLEDAVNNSSGSEIREIKAAELLTEISRTQSEEVSRVLDDSINNLAQKLEDKILALPEDARAQTILDYVETEPGNPIRQFEAAQELKEHFNDPAVIAIAEEIKDKAVENLTELVSEITDGSAKQDFIDIVVGNKPADLKVIIDIEARVTPPAVGGVIEATPISETVEEIKVEVEQNIIDQYKDKPEKLAEAILPPEDHGTDILDVEVVEELANFLPNLPEVTKLESEVINNFLDSVTEESSLALTPTPQIISELVELKDKTPDSLDVKIDVAIEAEVQLITDYISAIDDPQTFENYLDQIQQNPVVENTIVRVGGNEIIDSIVEKAKVIDQVGDVQQTFLEETVSQVTEEIFSTTASKVEETLPETVIAEIEEIKQEVPVEQIPAVQVQATVTVTASPEPVAPNAPVSEPAPAPVPATVPEAPKVGF